VADGTITSDIVARSSNIIFSGTVAANTGIAGMFYADHNGRRGPDGHAIYVLPTNGQFDVNMECLIKRKTSYDAVVR
jgi:hypothetical protein